jgi:hypothetical protein
MENSEELVVLSDAQSAENPLDDNGQKRNRPQPFHPFTVFQASRQSAETNRQKAYSARNEPVGMLEEDASYPVRDREQKHVVSEAVRPVWNRHSGAVTRY